MRDGAVVLGATGGLGPAVVAMFLARGDDVVAVARSREQLDKLGAGLPRPIQSETADLTSPDEVDALWRRIGETALTVRWLVNVTGGFAAGRVTDTSADTLRQMINLNLETAWHNSRAAALAMQEKGGAIVNVASRSAILNEVGSAAYSVSKAAVVKLTQVLAEEMKASGVRVNAVVPGIIDTPSNRESIPAKRMEKAVEPDAIARVIGFLCSEEAAPITGALIPVSGRL
jgi:NAD(P)-dependent dehydrogenase (short-subunit alcohol dehydrogenase family)